MADLKARAIQAFVESDFEIAVDLYTQAISMSPNDAVLFCQRSEVYMRLRNFTEALADAESAMALDPSLHLSYFRKGNACYHLEDYHNAKAVLEAGSFRVPGNAKFVHLIKECEKRIAGTGSQGPSSPSSKRKRVDSDMVEAQVTEVAIPGADAFQQKGKNLGGGAAVRAVLERSRRKSPTKGS